MMHIQETIFNMYEKVKISLKIVFLSILFLCYCNTSELSRVYSPRVDNFLQHSYQLLECSEKCISVFKKTKDKHRQDKFQRIYSRMCKVIIDCENMPDLNERIDEVEEKCYEEIIECADRIANLLDKMITNDMILKNDNNAHRCYDNLYQELANNHVFGSTDIRKIVQ